MQQEQISISDTAWSDLMTELSQICAKGEMTDALKFLLDNQVKSYATEKKESRKSVHAFRNEDFDKIICAIETLDASDLDLTPPISLEPIDNRLFMPMLRRINLEEGDHVLHKTLERHRLVRVETVKVDPHAKRSQSLTSMPNTELNLLGEIKKLVQYAANIKRGSTLQDLLILSKFCLCDLDKGHSDGITISCEPLINLVRNSSLITWPSLEKILYSVKKQERIARIAALKGSPYPAVWFGAGYAEKSTETADAINVNGEVCGVINGLRISSGRNYYEVKIAKGRGKNVRVGWALCGSSFIGGGGRKCPSLGMNDTSWGIGNTDNGIRTYHATALKAEEAQQLEIGQKKSLEQIEMHEMDQELSEGETEEGDESLGLKGLFQGLLQALNVTWEDGGDVIVLASNESDEPNKLLDWGPGTVLSCLIDLDVPGGEMYFFVNGVSVSGDKPVFSEFHIDKSRAYCPAFSSFDGEDLLTFNLADAPPSLELPKPEPLSVYQSKVSRCVKFDGQGYAVISKPNSSLLAKNRFMVDTLVSPASFIGEQVLFSGKGGRLSFGLSNRRLCLNLLDSEKKEIRLLSPDLPIEVEEWVHLSFIVSSSWIKFFVNRELIHMCKIGSLNSDFSDEFLIGAHFDKETQLTNMHFCGSIAQVKILNNSPVVMEQIQGRKLDHHSHKYLVGHWMFDEGEGNTCHDISYNRNVSTEISSSHAHLMGAWVWQSCFDPLKLDGFKELQTPFNPISGTVEDDVEQISGLKSTEKMAPRGIRDILLLVMGFFSSLSTQYLEPAEGNPQFEEEFKDIIQLQSARRKQKKMALLCQPHVLTFLLLHSLLWQVAQMIEGMVLLEGDVKRVSTSMTDVSKLRMLLVVAFSLLRTLRANLYQMRAMHLSGGTMGLSAVGRVKDRDRPFAMRLLQILLDFTGGVADINSSVTKSDVSIRRLQEAIRREASETIGLGIEIFCPVEILAMVLKQCDDESQEMILHKEQDERGEIGQLTIDRHGCYMLLACLTRAMSKSRILLDMLVPKKFCPNMRQDKLDAYILSLKEERKKSNSWNYGSEIAPQIWDLVLRGPQWCWGEQDMSTSSSKEDGNIGIIIKIGKWPSDLLQANDSALTVLWSNGTSNVYRWGVIDEMDAISYDVLILSDEATRKNESTEFSDLSFVLNAMVHVVLSISRDTVVDNFNDVFISVRSLIANIQQMLINFEHKLEPQISSDKSPNDLEVFAGALGFPMKWNWLECTYGALKVESELLKTDSQGLDEFAFPPDFCHCNISVGTRNDQFGFVLKDHRNLEWGIALASVGWKQGIGIRNWKICVSQFSNPGSIICGIATQNVPLNDYLGCNETGWGYCLSQDLYHNGISVQSSYGLPISQKDVLLFTLDTDCGTLSIKNETTNEDFGIAFDNLYENDNILLYPAFCLQNCDDQIEIFRIKAPTSPAVMVSNRTRKSQFSPVGYPTDILFDHVMILLNRLRDTLDWAIPSGISAISDLMVKHPLLSKDGMLRGPLAALSQWFLLTDDEDERLIMAICKVWDTLAKAIGILGSESGNKSSNLIALEHAHQFQTLLGCISGKVFGNLISSAGVPSVCNSDVAAFKTNAETLRPISRPGYSEGKSLKGKSSKPSHSMTYWLSSPLLANGPRLPITDFHQEFVLGLIECVSGTPEAALCAWAMRWSGENPVLQRVGGARLARATRHAAAAILWHGGYLDMALRLSHGINQEISAARSPPFYILETWRRVGTLRTWAKSLRDTGTPYEITAHRLEARAQFLLSLEPMNASRRASWLVDDYLTAESVASHPPSPVGGIQHNPPIIRRLVTGSRVSTGGDATCGLVHTLSAQFDSVAILTSSFLKEISDNIDDLAILKAAQVSAERRAHRRTLAFTTLRSMLISLPEGGSSGAKVALLYFLPFALRGIFGQISTSNKDLYALHNEKLSSIEGGSFGGHYLDGLEGCGHEAVLQVRQAFQSLYAQLARELAIAGSYRDVPLQLALLDAWGIVVHEEDHDVLATIRIFSVLQEVLGGASNAGTSAQLLTQATMKLVYLLAMQVATTGENSNLSISTEMNLLAPPPLVRVVSGPVTLSDSVFHMLYAELHTLVEGMVRRRQEAILKFNTEKKCRGSDSEHEQLLNRAEKMQIENHSLNLSSESQVLLSETVMLLCCLCADSSCAKQLARPRWAVLLIRLLRTGTTYARRSALLLLRIVLPLCSPMSLGPDVFKAAREAAMVPTFLATDETSDGATEIVRMLLGMVGSDFYIGGIEKEKRAIPDESDFPAYVLLQDAACLTDEAVSLLRGLLYAGAWRDIVCNVLKHSFEEIGTIFQKNSNEESDILLLLQTIGAASVVGGHVDALYPGTHAIVTDEPHSITNSSYNANQSFPYVPLSSCAEPPLKNRTCKIVSLNLQNGNAKVTFENSTESLTNGSKSSSVIISLEYLKAIPKVNIDAAKLPGPLVDAVLAATQNLCVDSKETVHKDEISKIEDTKKVSTRLDSCSIGARALLSILQFSLSRAACCLLANNYERIHNFIYACGGLNFIDRSTSSCNSTDSGDIDPLETYFSILGAQWRYKMLFSRVEAIQACKEALIDKDSIPTKPSDPTDDTPKPTEVLSTPDPPQVGGSQAPQEAPELVRLMSDMGFPYRWCQRALAETGGEDIEAALNWILSNGEILSTEDNMATVLEDDSSALPPPDPSPWDTTFLDQNRIETASVHQAWMDAVNGIFEQKDGTSSSDEELPRTYMYDPNLTFSLELKSGPQDDCDTVSILVPGEVVVVVGLYRNWFCLQVSDDEEDGDDENDSSFEGEPIYVGDMEEIDEMLTRSDRRLNNIAGMAWAPKELDGQSMFIRLGNKESMQSQHAGRGDHGDWDSSFRHLNCTVNRSFKPEEKVDGSGIIPTWATEIEVGELLFQEFGAEFYRREERFFGSRQGHRLPGDTRRERKIADIARCARIWGCPDGSFAGAWRKCSELGSDDASIQLTASSDTLCTLYIREMVLFALLQCEEEAVKACHENTEGFEVEKPQYKFEMTLSPKAESHLASERTLPYRSSKLCLLLFSGTGILPRQVADSLLRFLKLVLFGRSDKVGGDDMDNIGYTLPLRLLSLVSFLLEQRNEFAEVLQEVMLEFLDSQLCLATSPEYANLNWNSSFFDNTGPLPFILWVSRTLMQSNRETELLLPRMFESWCLALKSPNLSLREQVCKALSCMVHSVISRVDHAQELDKPKVAHWINACLEILPIERLRILTEHRFLREIDDYPLYSRVLQASIDLLAAIQLVKNVIEQYQVAEECPKLEDQKSGWSIPSRTVLQLSSPKSYVNISEMNLEPPWTAEYWLMVEDSSEMNLNTPPTGLTVAGTAHRAVSTGSMIVPGGPKSIPPGAKPRGLPRSFLLGHSPPPRPPLLATRSGRSGGENYWKSSSIHALKPLAPRPPLVPANNESVPKQDVAPKVLAMSSSSFIKLRAGGKSFSSLKEEEGEEPVAAESDCVSIGCDSEQKFFDYVFPTGRWVHMALVAEKEVTLYIDGELIDSVPMYMHLPMQFIGSGPHFTLEGCSFTGKLAEVRYWQYARSIEELRRDSNRSIHSMDGLVGLWNMDEGRGTVVKNKSNSVYSKMSDDCLWVSTPFSSKLPPVHPAPTPWYWLTAYGIKPEVSTAASLKNSEIVTMTGIFEREAVPNAEEFPWAARNRQVAILRWHIVEKEKLDSNLTINIVGALEFPEERAFLDFSGTLSNDKHLLEGKLGEVLQGCPKRVGWVSGMKILGTLEGMGGKLTLKSSWNASPLPIQRLKPLEAGRMRINVEGLPDSVLLSNGNSISYTFSLGAGMLSRAVQIGPQHGAVLVMVDVCSTPPFSTYSDPIGSPDVTTHPPGGCLFHRRLLRRRSKSMVSAEVIYDTIVRAGDKVDFKPPSIAPVNVKLSWGFTFGCRLWEWEVTSTQSGGPLSGFGVADYLFAKSSRERVPYGKALGEGQGSWAYRKDGYMIHDGSNKEMIQGKYSSEDVIGLQLDMDLGVLSFYKNEVFCGCFNDFDSISRFNDDETDEFCGLRPCVSLCPRESVRLLGPKEGKGFITYKSDDIYQREKWEGIWVAGMRHGPGTLSYSNSTKKWRGHWFMNKQHGLQILQDTSDESSILDGFIFNCDIKLRKATEAEMQSSLVDEIMEERAKIMADREEKRLAEIEAERINLEAQQADAKRAYASAIRQLRDEAALMDSRALSRHTRHGKSRTCNQAADNEAGESVADNANREEDSELNTTQNPENGVIPGSNQDLGTSNESKNNEPLQDICEDLLSLKLSKSGSALNDSNDTVRIDDTKEEDSSLWKVDPIKSTPLYVLRVVYPGGATARKDIDIDTSDMVGTVPTGSVVEASARAIAPCGAVRYLTTTGWISEKLRGGAEEMVVEVLKHTPVEPLRYTVICRGGAMLRETEALDSRQLGGIPSRTLVEVAERVRLPNDTMRLRVSSPTQYVGWISEKGHIVRQEIPDSEADTLVAEVQRRQNIRTLRKTSRAERATSQSLDGELATPHGTLNLTTSVPFLLDRATAHGGAVVSDDFSALRYDASASHGGRAMVLGTKGFRAGVHYWEVNVDKCGWGSVFIGVAPRGSQPWSGYGFLNYRACQAYGNETLYGAYFTNGDKVGVLLDMDKGTLSFIKDGTDFNVETLLVKHLGVAYRNLHNSRSNQCLDDGGDEPTFRGNYALYPCFGVKGSGDCLSITNAKWIGEDGMCEKQRLSNAVNSIVVLQELNRSFKMKLPPPKSLLATAENLFKVWNGGMRKMYTCRAGINVEIDVTDEGLAEITGPDMPTLHSGQSIKTPHGNATILGTSRGDIWYNLGSDAESLGAWYFTVSEFRELLESDEIFLLDKPPKRSQSATNFNTPFSMLMEKWKDINSDSALVWLINTAMVRAGVPALQLQLSDLIELWKSKSDGLPTNITIEHIVSRMCFILAVNMEIVQVVSFVDLAYDNDSGRLAITEAELRSKKVNCLTGLCASGKAISDLRRLLLMRTKMDIWGLAVAETTTFTMPNPDEYERPDGICEVEVNRVRARALMVSIMTGGDSPPLLVRLKVSVFGQLYEAMGNWADREFRRGFVHTEDASQARAFYVRARGEGVDDHGGPYRAVFQAALGEEPGELLGFLEPSSNARNRFGPNQDRMVFTGVGESTPLLWHFGRLLGTAGRHRIHVPLTLPSLVWKPFVGVPLNRSDLDSVDRALARGLSDAEAGHLDPEEEVAVLREALEWAGGGDHIGGIDGVAMTREERQRAVSVVERQCLTRHAECLEALYAGVAAVVPVELLALFTPSEVEELFCGVPEVDVDLLQRVTVHEGVSAMDHHIQFFWTALRGMDAKDRAAFINFCSGRARLPSSATDFPLNFTLTAHHPMVERNPDDYLPLAQTCFFSLALPRYSSLEVCRTKLLYAIHNSNLMDADYVMRSAEGWEDLS